MLMAAEEENIVEGKSVDTNASMVIVWVKSVTVDDASEDPS